MTILQATVLGLIQGITEFFPISSSGHLILIPGLFGWGASPLVFDTTLHLGTSLALILYFWQDIKDLLLKNRRVLVYLVVASIPAALFGFFFDSFIELVFRDVFSVLIFLLLGTFFMFLAEQLYSPEGTLTLLKSLYIGFFQTFALFPGISRSGITISAGMYSGLNRREAARFAFLLAIPVTLGAGLYEGLSAFGSGLNVSLPVLFAGAFAAFISGYLSVKFLLKFLTSHTLYPFIIYRLFLALVVVGVVIL